MEIKDYISEECITFHLSATTKEDAILEMASLLYKAKKITDLDVFVDAVKKRELEFTTGIGDGIAIPHGESSVVKTACIAYGRSEKGVEWKSLDERSVYSIFMLAIPCQEDEAHLEMLSNLARKLMHKEVKEAVRQALQVDEFYKAIN